MKLATEPTAIETAAMIARGETSAIAETEAAIARIEERDGPINAVVVRDFERARTAAKSADERLARGESGPLLGVPMTVKESNDIAGLPSTWGMEEHRDNITERDSPSVARLKAAGAVVLGKTNVPPLLADWQSDNPVYGRTNNPHDLSRSPGGSSGGAAAALASGMVPLELGSDIGGSIRVPAHFCGVYGLKPSYGIVPLEGHYFPGTDGADIPLSAVGPMARSAEDIALAIDLLSEIALPRPRCRSLDQARLLVITDHPVAPTQSAIADAVTTVAETCARAGATIETRSDKLPGLALRHGEYMRMLLTVLAARMPNPELPPPDLPAWFEILDAQARCRREWRALFEEFDAVLTPVAGITAFPYDPKDMRDRVLTINGAETPFASQFGWIGMATYPGLPAISAPIGEDEGGLPIGLQIIGDMHQDQTVVELARLIAQA